VDYIIIPKDAWRFGYQSLVSYSDVSDSLWTRIVIILGCWSPSTLR